jgi:pimeloyl-ACP methyl ester carboxylesterase
VGYEERGSGTATPLVLLHAFPFSRGGWAGLIDELAARRRVIAVDARGFGESPLRGTYTVASLASDVGALLDSLSIPRAVLLGMSMGGYTALAFAARFLARLAGLILANTRAGADSADARAGRDKAIATIKQAGVEAYLTDSLARLLSPSAPPALLGYVRAQAETRPASLVAGLEAMRARPDRTSELGAIRCPTLVIGGAEDQLVPRHEIERMAAAIPGAKLAMIPGAGHLSHLEAPTAFAAEVNAFLDGLADGSAV